MCFATRRNSPGWCLNFYSLRRNRCPANTSPPGLGFFTLVEAFISLLPFNTSLSMATPRPKTRIPWAPVFGTPVGTSEGGGDGLPLAGVVCAHRPTAGCASTADLDGVSRAQEQWDWTYHFWEVQEYANKKGLKWGPDVENFIHFSWSKYRGLGVLTLIPFSTTPTDPMPLPRRR